MGKSRRENVHGKMSAWKSHGENVPRVRGVHGEMPCVEMPRGKCPAGNAPGRVGGGGGVSRWECLGGNLPKGNVPDRNVLEGNVLRRKCPVGEMSSFEIVPGGGGGGSLGEMSRGGGGGGGGEGCPNLVMKYALIITRDLFSTPYRENKVGEK